MHGVCSLRASFHEGVDRAAVRVQGLFDRAAVFLPDDHDQLDDGGRGEQGGRGALKDRPVTERSQGL